MNTGEYDIAIVGGGLVGASLACALAGLEYSVALLEAVTPQASDQPSYDDRTLALNHASCQILRGLELWPRLREGATPIREIHVSELGRPGQVTLKAVEHGLEAFGNVVEARVFGAAVLQRLPELGQVTFLCPAKVTGLQQMKGSVKLAYSTGDKKESLRARLVVAADGARSTVRELAGVEADIHDYRQTAVIANVTPQQPHGNRAFERFTETGPLAILPHTGPRCGVVWCVPRGAEKALVDGEDSEFLLGMQERFGKRLGSFEKAGVRSSYPLYLVQAKTNIAGRVLIMGNAAHTIHPNSAQGFNLGLRDAAVLAETLADSAGSDPGEQSLLMHYDSWRQPDQDSTIRYSDGLARIFSNPSLTMGAARFLGMAMHQLIPPLRRKLALGAMGFRGRVPRLARGENLVAKSGR
jgi:2-octaprenyl-6-methoxyphenol hydroxylase